MRRGIVYLIRHGIVRSRLSISGAPATNLTKGQPYVFQPNVRGGKKPYSFSATGALPPGLNININTGAVTGTPT